MQYLNLLTSVLDPIVMEFSKFFLFGLFPRVHSSSHGGSRALVCQHGSQLLSQHARIWALHNATASDKSLIVSTAHKFKPHVSYYYYCLCQVAPIKYFSLI